MKYPIRTRDMEFHVVERALCTRHKSEATNHTTDLSGVLRGRKARSDERVRSDEGVFRTKRIVSD